MSENYCLISPCRDEITYIRRTLDSILAQTVLPDQWVIVDDGSTDGTAEVLKSYAEKYDWIQVLHRNSQQRRVGGGVVEAFYFGLDQINLADFEFFCKLDMDVDLPATYFEILIERMRKNPNLGTCSGKPYFPAKGNTTESFDGALISEACGNEMSVGMTKFYRIRCFQEIGGFVSTVMWDGIDCHRCRMLGWEAESWDEPDLRFLHLRPMGASDKGILTGRMRHGFGQYYMGTSPIYMAASAAYRLSRPPYVLGGVAMMWGYVKSMLARKPKYEDLEFRRFLRRYQWLCLLKGKKKATAEVLRRKSNSNNLAYLSFAKLED